MIISENKATKVQPKKIERDNFMYVFCECCKDQIVESDLQENPSNRNYAALCDECCDIGLHVRCMSISQRHEFTEDESFMCKNCYDNDDYDEESIDSDS